jgi:hypothetical protein
VWKRWAQIRPKPRPGSRAAARGDRESQKLLKEAQAAKQDEQRLYQIRRRLPQILGQLVLQRAVLLVWSSSGWNLR